MNGVHPSLVFNMDEMGAEMFADRKHVFVFVPAQDVPENHPLMVGVPRSTRRCTLIGCISPDGTRLRHAIITKTVTISSVVFTEGGFPSNRLKICHTQNSFINNDVFGEWLCDVLLPEIETRRAWLRERLGDYDDRAVLILDGLKCHTMEPFVEFLRMHNVTMVVLVPHSSHLTQPLDVGIFWDVKRLMRSSGKYLINLHVLDQAMAVQTEAETHGHEVPPERGRLLAEHVLRILRSYEQATTSDNVVSAFRQVGVHWRVVEEANHDRRVTYIDPSTARLVVGEYGVIPLPDDRRQDRSPAWQLKISELNSGYQSPMAQQMRRELAEIREALAPPAERRSVPQRTTHPQGAQKNRPGPSTPCRRASRGPSPACRSSPQPAPSRPRQPAPAAVRIPQSSWFCCYPNSHSGGDYEVLPGSGSSPQTQGPGPF